MRGSALVFRCHSHFLFGLLQATAAKDTTAVAEHEVRVRIPVNQTAKRRLRVRSPWRERESARRESSRSCPSKGLTLSGKANRETPAQAELRPTSAETSRVNPSTSPDRSVCLLALNQSTSRKIKSFNKGAINSPWCSPRSLCSAPIASQKTILILCISLLAYYPCDTCVDTGALGASVGLNFAGQPVSV
jgi:hypothetical protein